MTDAMKKFYIYALKYGYGIYINEWRSISLGGDRICIELYPPTKNS